MTTFITSPSNLQNTFRSPAALLRPWVWLIAGVAITALVGTRFNVGLLGWVAAVPWLVYLRSSSGWRSRVLLLGALQVGMFLQILKIVTEPIPWIFAPMFSVPMALGAGLLYLGFEWGRRRLGDGWGLILFPAMATAIEWIGWRSSEFGSWGAAAYTQIDNLPLLQTTALVGLSGIALLTSTVAALVALLVVERPSMARLPAILTVATLVVAAHIYGSFRIFSDLPGPTLPVAAIVSDVGMGSGGLPSDEELRQANEDLFARTVLAAERGAQLVAWNEGATAISKADEAQFLARGSGISADYGIDLVLAYVVPLDGMKLFENKYVWLTPQGEAETYFKHHPVPGEGSVRGEEVIRVLDRPYGQVAGALCYDYDFPTLARQHARGGAGLVVVPSSDWKGIDPYHTQMARVRGIEGGFSVLRPVRWATSGAYDALGRARATMSFFEDNDRIMMAHLPTGHVDTLYTHIGDLLPAICLGFTLLGFGIAWRRRSEADQLAMQGSPAGKSM